MKAWAKGLVLGGGLALLVLAVLSGLDMTILLFPLSLLALGALLIHGRGGLTSRFAPARLGGEESSVPAVTFSQIGGQETAKRELLEALTFLKESSRTKQLGIRPLKDVLLVGPPGTGKTFGQRPGQLHGFRFPGCFRLPVRAEYVERCQQVRQLFKQAQTWRKAISPVPSSSSTR